MSRSPALRHRPTLRTVVLAAVVSIGVGAAIVSTAFGGPPQTRIVRGDQPVDAGARDPGDIRANNSPAMARNPERPGNLVVVNRIDTPAYDCAMHVSFDGGASWAATRIPVPAGEEPKCFAPDVAFGRDGTLFVAFVTLHGRGNSPHAAWLVRSRDGGRTLSRPQRVLGPLAFQVRIAADPRRAGRLYLTWLQVSKVGIYSFPQAGNPILAARSDDGGATWTRPVRLSPASRQRVLAPSPVVGPNGDLYVAYLDVGGDRLDYEGAHGGNGGPPYPGRFSLVLARSSDGARTWQESVVDDRIAPIGRFLSFLPPFPAVTVDPHSGRVYVAFHDARLGDADVWLWSLPRGATAWQGPTRVVDTPSRDGTSQYLPRLAVAPDGRLDVVYYDRRFDPKDVMSDVSLQSSYDHGATFTPSITLTSRRFDSRIGTGSERGMPDLGSRLGLLSDDRTAVAVWTDTRAGTVASNKQDIARAIVAFSEPARLSPLIRALLRYGGLALAAAALALLLRDLQRRFVR